MNFQKNKLFLWNKNNFWWPNWAESLFQEENIQPVCSLLSYRCWVRYKTFTALSRKGGKIQTRLFYVRISSYGDFPRFEKAVATWWEKAALASGNSEKSNSDSKLAPKSDDRGPFFFETFSTVTLSVPNCFSINLCT